MLHQVDTDAKNSNRGVDLSCRDDRRRGSTPAFLKIAAKAAPLRELGMSDRAIARAIGVSDKTVAKSLRRFRIDENLGAVDEALGPEDDRRVGQSPQY